MVATPTVIVLFFIPIIINPYCPLFLSATNKCVHCWNYIKGQNCRKQQPSNNGYSHRNPAFRDRKSTRLNSSHVKISYAVFCLKKKKITERTRRKPSIKGLYSSQSNPSAQTRKSYRIYYV